MAVGYIITDLVTEETRDAEGLFGDFASSPGSFGLPEANSLRFFLCWKNGEDRTDIDLSALFFSDGWNRLGQITYYNLPENGLGCYHCGDIVDAPESACEFVDLLASDSMVSLPVIIDLEKSQVIWADVALKNSSWINNVQTNGDNIARLSRAMAELNRPNLLVDGWFVGPCR